MRTLLFALTVVILSSCNKVKEPNPAIGTWKLLKGEIIEGIDTTHVDYTKDELTIKLITPTHFSFMRHDLNHGKDSSKIIYVSGGGRCELSDTNYVEHLEFCNYREWEGGEFHLTLKVHGDTLIQTGVEKMVNLGIDRINTETYIRF